MKPLKKISWDYWRQLRLRYEKIQNVQLFGQRIMDGHGLACGSSSYVNYRMLFDGVIDYFI